jgi:hypothetical protein
MTKLAGSECEMILKLAGDAIGDKGFIGTDYIITPVRKPKHRDLLRSGHGYNNQISSLRAPVERAIANLKTWRILFTDYRRPLKTFLSSFRAAIGLYFFKEGVPKAEDTVASNFLTGISASTALNMNAGSPP